jgi:uncharacterized protein YhbP (UPF0306 family)
MPVRTIAGSIRDPRTRRALFAILKRNVLCAMSTVGPRGRAHVNTAYYAFSPDLAFYFYSYPTSRHAQNLEKSPSMAIAVYDSRQVWGREDKGLQFFGTCRPLVGTRASGAARVYGRRFPGYTEWMKSMDRENRSHSIRPLQFEPERATLFDERVFGGGVFVDIPLRKTRRASRSS